MRPDARRADVRLLAARGSVEFRGRTSSPPPGGVFHRDVAQPGSALAWGARGREFKSRRPDQFSSPRGFRSKFSTLTKMATSSGASERPFATGGCRPELFKGDPGGGTALAQRESAGKKRGSMSSGGSSVASGSTSSLEGQTTSTWDFMRRYPPLPPSIFCNHGVTPFRLLDL